MLGKHCFALYLLLPWAGAGGQAASFLLEFPEKRAF
jgi:hypothetical protein